MLTTDTPEPRFVLTDDGLRIATYDFGDADFGDADFRGADFRDADFGDADAPTVVAVHGFASGAMLNWHASAWTRDLVRGGFRVIAIDQRGHGLSSKPHDPSAYSMQRLVDDVLLVLDAYVLDRVAFLGYSLGARVGWQLARERPERITSAILGGIPDGDPLTRFRVDQARAQLESNQPVADALTARYITMASGIRGNDLSALVALVEGMRGGVVPDPLNPPQQPVLFATGSDDGILEKSRVLAAATPLGMFVEIPRRHHFNAPISREFREAGLRFLRMPAS